MPQASSFEAAILRFGLFELDLKDGELRRSGRAVKLQPQPFRLLTLLASRRGELVTRDEIRASLWDDDTFVDFEQGENHCVRQIRAALGDDARHPRYIQTVPRRGYRFVAPVQGVDVPLPADTESHAEASAPATPAAEAAPWEPAASTSLPSRPRARRRRLSWIAALVIAGIAIWHEPEAPAAARTRLAVMPLANLTEHGSLANGLTYEITTRLVQYRPESLQLVSGLSTRAYQASKKTAAEIARELNADYLLEGSLQQVAGRVQVTVQLTNARGQTPVWAESYVRPVGDVLSVQNELAERIVAQVASRVP